MSSPRLSILVVAIFFCAMSNAQVAPPSSAEAWAQLHTAFEAKSVNTRVKALTALSVLGSNREGEQMLRKAFHDDEVDVRIAAIVAAGETRNRNLSGDLRGMLDDDAPQIAFAAATTLWKMGDHSGEDILLAVLRGERKASPGFVKSATHNASRTLRSPAALLKIGAMQATGILVPPVGIGMGAYQYLSGPSKNPRVQALDLLTGEHNEMVHRELIDATDDKDDAVRLAASESLVKYPGKATTDALGHMFGDRDTGVRLMACAAFIRLSSSAASGPRRR